MGPEVGFCPPRILDSVLVLSTWLSNSAPTWTCFSECGWGAASVAEQVAGPWLAPMQHTNHFSASFPSSSTLLRSCFTKSCRPSEQPWPPPEETRKVPRPANSRSQTVLVSRDEGVWDAMFLSCLLSREWHPWSPCCSVQRSCHLLRQRPLWLPPQAAVWKSPKRQQQVRGERVDGVCSGPCTRGGGRLFFFLPRQKEWFSAQNFSGFSMLMAPPDFPWSDRFLSCRPPSSLGE